MPHFTLATFAKCTLTALAPFAVAYYGMPLRPRLSAAADLPSINAGATFSALRNARAPAASEFALL